MPTKTANQTTDKETAYYSLSHDILRGKEPKSIQELFDSIDSFRHNLMPLSDAKPGFSMEKTRYSYKLLEMQLAGLALSDGLYECDMRIESREGFITKLFIEGSRSPLKLPKDILDDGMLGHFLTASLWRPAEGSKFDVEVNKRGALHLREHEISTIFDLYQKFAKEHGIETTLADIEDTTFFACNFESLKRKDTHT